MELSSTDVIFEVLILKGFKLKFQDFVFCYASCIPCIIIPLKHAEDFNVCLLMNLQ